MATKTASIVERRNGGAPQRPRPDEVRVTVPAEYAEDFRAALEHEIAMEVECVKDEDARISRALECRQDVSTADRDGARRMLALQANLLGQVEAADGDIEVALVDRYGVVAHVFETMARDIVGLKIMDEMGPSPIGSDDLPKLRALTERLSWTLETTARLHDKAVVAVRAVA
jgi:hypothetical protein